MSTPKILLVGGFLGAGKTTLLDRAAGLLRARDVKIGIITNDQAAELVDTAWLSRDGETVREVSGSCFCCNFSGFAAAVDYLTEGGAGVILAEPVGSCTDLSATILQPLKALRPGVQLAPFTVALDPAKAREALAMAAPTIHKDALYILKLQLAEADVILLNKADSLSDDEVMLLATSLRTAYGNADVRVVSAQENRGVEEWLDALLAAGKSDAGRTLAEVDYDRYANGEAVLGWLNLAARPVWKELADGHRFVTDFLLALRRELLAKGMQVGHVKILCPFPDGVYKGNLIDVNTLPHVVRDKRSEFDMNHEFIVNARVECEPEALEQMIRAALAEAGGDEVVLEDQRGKVLKPGRPEPTYRYSHVV